MAKKGKAKNKNKKVLTDEQKLALKQKREATAKKKERSLKSFHGLDNGLKGSKKYLDFGCPGGCDSKFLIMQKPISLKEALNMPEAVVDKILHCNPLDRKGNRICSSSSYKKKEAPPQLNTNPRPNPNPNPAGPNPNPGGPGAGNPAGAGVGAGGPQPGPGEQNKPEKSIFSKLNPLNLLRKAYAAEE